MERSNWLSASAVIALGLFAILGFVSLTSFAISWFPGTTLDIVLTVVLSLIAVVVTLAMLVVVYALFGLHDRKQALGLPDGSVRALVAMMLLIVLAIFAGYYFDHLDRTAREGQADFAKQVISVIATLVTAVVSFYFASRTSQDVASGRDDSSDTPPTVDTIKPKSSPSGEPVTIEITGTKLQDVTGVQLVRGGDRISAKSVTVSASDVACHFDIAPTTPKGKWDLVLQVPQAAARIDQAFEIR